MLATSSQGGTVTKVQVYSTCRRTILFCSPGVRLDVQHSSSVFFGPISLVSFGRHAFLHFLYLLLSKIGKILDPCVGEMTYVIGK